MRFINLLTAALLPAAVVQAFPEPEFDISARGGSQSCYGGQYWDSKQKCCQCPDGKEWKDNKCKHKPMPKPKCGHNENAYCAKGKNDWCYYDENKKECKDNGKCVTFCAKKGKEQKWCNDYYD
ncbi:hypothetical protein BJ166DRAFT_592436 [Pestalotiopsis sp. NC0098]|nr:hypothetical protein BJ166DRAFT_592436 [Pestalotiopsis sp. NC0098]